MLWCIFDKWLVDFTNLEEINTDYFSLKFDDYLKVAIKIWVTWNEVIK